MAATAPALRISRRKRGLFAEIAHHWADYVYVLPAIFVLFLVIGYPIVYTIYLSFFETPSRESAIYFNGINNYREIMSDSLRNVILITTILLFVTNLNSFTLIFLMTGGGPAGATTIWIIAVYALGFLTPNYGLASAFAVILFLIMAVFGYFYVRVLTGDRDRRLHA
jgi:multiple sugar transport system permease protein